MTNPKSGPSDTPGRPKDSGSRQQSHPDQNLQSGSSELDKESGRKGGAAKDPPKPASAK
jgi:hypothetical protein